MPCFKQRLRAWALVALPVAVCAPSACSGQTTGGTAANEGGHTSSVGGSGSHGGAGGVPQSGWPDGGPGGAAGSGASGGSGGAPLGGTGGVAGQAAGGSGGSGGTGQSWMLYRYDLGAGSWSKIALSKVWTGANAPPPYGVVAATQLEHYDRLLVFSSSGRFYLRSNGTWQPPVKTTQAFPALANLSVTGVDQLPSAPGATPDEEITFVANPTAVLYAYHSNDAIVYEKTVTMTDDPAPAAPQGSGHALYFFERRDANQYGTAGYYYLYSGYDDGNLYRFDASFTWKSWPAKQSPMWSGKVGAPDPSTLTAAWTEAGLGIVDFVGP